MAKESTKIKYIYVCEKNHKTELDISINAEVPFTITCEKCKGSAIRNVAGEIGKLTTQLKKTYRDTFANPDVAGIIKRVIMSSPNMNFIFGGGFPVGKPITVFGPESGGKTALSSYVGGQFQRRVDEPHKRTILFIDMEYSFNKKYANNMGLDTDNNFIFIRPLHGEEGFEIVDKYVRSGLIGLVIWDSVAASPSSNIVSADYGKASYGGTAAMMSQALMKINPVLSRYETSMIFVNQVRAKIGGFQIANVPSTQENSNVGGWALKFYSGWRGRVSQGENIIIGKEVIGNQIKVKNVKSKIGMPKRRITLDLYYNGGLDTDSEYMDFIINLEMVNIKGSWIDNEEFKIKTQGRENFLIELKKNKDAWEALKYRVTQSFFGSTVLDTIDIDVSEESLDDEEVYDAREENSSIG